MNTEWQILEVHAEDEQVTKVRYKASYEGVETEGYCHFYERGSIPFDELSEVQIIAWVKGSFLEHGVCSVTARLKEQAERLKKQVEVRLPWETKTFKLPI
jgi:hypothetical protein